MVRQAAVIMFLLLRKSKKQFVPSSRDSICYNVNLHALLEEIKGCALQ